MSQPAHTSISMSPEMNSEHQGSEHQRSEANPADEGEATKPAGTILRQEIEVGTEQLERPALGLFLSAVSAGLDIGFGPFLVATVLAASPTDSVANRLVVALAYSIGFVIVILGRSELFTEHTALAILPLLSGDASIRQVGRLWGVVYTGNIVGATVFAGLAAPLGVALGAFAEAQIDEISSHLVDFGFLVVLASGIAAGWLMGLVSWLVTAARETISQIVIIVFVAGSISFLGLHHSIAGSVEVLMGVFVAGLPVGDFLLFLLGATIGNAIGGIVLVAGLKFGHVSRAGPNGRVR